MRELVDGIDRAAHVGAGQYDGLAHGRIWPGIGDRLDAQDFPALRPRDGRRPVMRVGYRDYRLRRLFGLFDHPHGAAKNRLHIPCEVLGSLVNGSRLARIHQQRHAGVDHHLRPRRQAKGGQHC